MELRQLYQFQTIVQYGNLTKAAEALYVAQPNMSRTLSALEKEVGAPLFYREKGRLVLNESGRLLFELCQRIFPDIEDTVRKIRDRNDSTLSCIRISMTSIHTVSECIGRFHQKNPEILLYQTTCTEKQLFQLLMQRETDVGITMNEIHDPLIASVKLADFEVVVGVSGAHPLASRTKIALQELQHYRFLCNSTGINQQMTERICRRAGFAPREALVLEDSYLIDRQMEQMEYVTLVPLEWKQQEIPMKLLKIVDYPQQVSLWACYNRMKPPPRPIQDLLEQMKAFYDDGETKAVVAAQENS